MATTPTTDYLSAWRDATDDGLDAGKSAYLEAMPAVATAAATGNAVNQLAGNAAMDSSALAKGLNARVGKFAGMQDTYADNAFGYSSEARKNQAAGAAMADVTSKFSGMREQGMRSLGRMGINPSSGRSQAMSGQIDIATASAQAAAGNKARQDIEQIGDDRQKTAIGFGNNAVTNANQTAQMVGQLGTGALAAGLVPYRAQMDFANGVNGIYGNAAAGYKGLWESQNLSPAQRAEAATASRNNTLNSIATIAGSTAGQNVIGKTADWISSLFGK